MLCCYTCDGFMNFSFKAFLELFVFMVATLKRNIKGTLGNFMCNINRSFCGFDSELN